MLVMNEIIGEPNFAVPVGVGYLHILYHRIDVVFPVIQKLVHSW